METKELLTQIQDSVDAKLKEANEKALNENKGEMKTLFDGLKTEFDKQMLELKDKVHSDKGYKASEEHKMLNKIPKTLKEGGQEQIIETKALIPDQIVQTNLLDENGDPYGRTGMNVSSNLSLTKPAFVPIDEFNPLSVFEVRLAKGSNFPYIDHTQNGEAGNTAEGGVSSVISSEYEAKLLTLQKITAIEGFSEEMLEDNQLYTSYLRPNLEKEITLKLRKEFFVGAGGTSAMNGLNNLCTTFAPAGKELPSGKAVYIQDLISAMATQVRQANFSTNTIFMNPDDYYQMVVNKNDIGNYVSPSPEMYNGYLNGLRLWTSNYVAPNSMIVCDKSLLQVILSKNAAVLMQGQKDDDFERGFHRLRGYIRLNNLLRENHKPAFVITTDIKQSIADLTTVVAP